MFSSLRQQLVIISFGAILTSCGLYHTCCRPTVTYAQATLNTNTYHIEHFPGHPTAFDTKLLEQIVDSIGYKGKANVKVLVANSGKVKDWKTLKSNLTDEHLDAITTALEQLKWLRFVGSPYGITTITFWTGRDFISHPDNRGWVTLDWPRPTTKSEL